MGGDQRVWFERAFGLGLPSDHMPEIVERLRGTPARLEERMREVDPDVLVRRPRDGAGAEQWSIQEHVGHLLDLESLWCDRVGDLADEREILTEADLQNRATWEADHNASPVARLLRAFRERRDRLVDRLEALDDAGLARTSLHPRLRQPMSAVDLAFFVAEHDDHHLATITALLRQGSD